MSRPLRIEFPNAWYHILNRGRRSESIFHQNQDYLIFLGLQKWGTLLTNCTSSIYPRLTICATPDVVIPLASAYLSAKPKLQKRCYPNNHP